MTKILVFTPTNRYGGLDVLEASLQRQNHENFEFRCEDQLLFERKEIWGEIVQRNREKFKVYATFHPIKEGNKRNLASAYNRAVDMAVRDNFDLFVSLQDYIWLPEDGLTRFAEVFEKYPDYIYTGVTHISRDPFPTKVFDRKGLYTIFEEPYTDKPKRLSWEDVRITDIYSSAPPNALVKDVEPNHWEANWSAVPVSLLKKGLKWNVDYDIGIAYENMDFAQRAAKYFGAKVIFDTGNVAISLPHKDYFDGEREEIIEFSNKEKFESSWGR